MKLWFHINIAWQSYYILVINLLSQTLKSILLFFAIFFKSPDLFSHLSDICRVTEIIPPTSSQQQIYKLLFSSHKMCSLEPMHIHNYRTFMVLLFLFISVFPILLCLLYLCRKYLVFSKFSHLEKCPPLTYSPHILQLSFSLFFFWWADVIISPPLLNFKFINKGYDGSFMV